MLGQRWSALPHSEEVVHSCCSSPQRLTNGLSAGLGLPRPGLGGVPIQETLAPPPWYHDASSLSFCYDFWTWLPSAFPWDSQKSDLLIKKGTVAASGLFPLL